jgi:hypothetical protein
MCTCLGAIDNSKVFHPEVLQHIKKYMYNVSVNSTTIYLYTTKIVYCQGDMFRPLLGHPQAH